MKLRNQDSPSQPCASDMPHNVFFSRLDTTAGDATLPKHFASLINWVGRYSFYQGAEYIYPLKKMQKHRPNIPLQSVDKLERSGIHFSVGGYLSMQNVPSVFSEAVHNEGLQERKYSPTYEKNPHLWKWIPLQRKPIQPYLDSLPWGSRLKLGPKADPAWTAAEKPLWSSQNLPDRRGYLQLYHNNFSNLNFPPKMLLRASYPEIGLYCNTPYLYYVTCRN